MPIQNYTWGIAGLLSEPVFTVTKDSFGKVKILTSMDACNGLAGGPASESGRGRGGRLLFSHVPLHCAGAHCDRGRG